MEPLQDLPIGTLLDAKMVLVPLHQTLGEAVLMVLSWAFWLVMDLKRKRKKRLNMGTLHKAETFHNKGMKFTSQVNNHEFVMDDADGDSGPRPKPLLLSALAACTGMDVVSILEKMRVNFSDFSMETEGDLTDEHPKVYSEIRLTYRIRVANEDQEKVKKAVELSEEKYCGVGAMLKMVCPIVYSIKFI